MQLENINNKITYNEYVVLSVRIINLFVFVRTYSKVTGEIFWFIGFKTNDKINEVVRKTLVDGTCYPNQYFKSMFEENYKTNPIKIKENKNERKNNLHIEG